MTITIHAMDLVGYTVGAIIGIILRAISPSVKAWFEFKRKPKSYQRAYKTMHTVLVANAGWMYIPETYSWLGAHFLQGYINEDVLIKGLITHTSTAPSNLELIEIVSALVRIKK